MSKYKCQSIGPKSRSVIRRDKKVISPSLTREFDFVYKKAKGMYVWDEDGRKYLDFSSGLAVLNSGHNHPEIIKAINKQLISGMHMGFADFYSKLPVEYAEKLLSLMPRMDKVFFANSGTEANEAAFKLCRYHTKRKKFISFTPSFHGRTMGSLSLQDTGVPAHKKGFEPFFEVHHPPYGYCYRCAYGQEYGKCGFECIKAVENLTKKDKDCAGMFYEPVMGEPGYVVPPIEFVKGIREICDKNNILLCADEIQSGAFRTGKFLASENFKVKNDIVTLGKGLGGGLPTGIMVSNNKVMTWEPGSHANTFGGNFLVCAAGLAFLDIAKKEKLAERAKHAGRYLLKRVKELYGEYEIIGDVRGLGLMIGIEFVKNRKTKAYAVKEKNKILCKSIQKGLLLLPAGKSSIRFSPPLIVKRKQIDLALDIFEDAIKEVSK
ncbi:aminotransferase class III-fold pyridoxal phosphate-dependent enzyme [Candidatus Woesearchaeota archaeon]|nr:aminotransferase class III-fold pyridoxal phosphate-dependent enzyme [Candidatus Woesearchaeota archaeon]MBW3021654.1 aminotransferase class III-fold pyridoxal phosphate-dependent enzyme [Candidatus Woesearchaeota archaeon]